MPDTGSTVDRCGTRREGGISCMKEEGLSMAPEAHVTRRQFVVTTLAAGFALAVQPVSAETITTDTKGLIAGEVSIPTTDGPIPAYRAMPATGNSFPVVLVVQEIFGVHEHIRDICRRFAKLGHLAVAPELFAHQGDVSKIGITGFCWGGRIVWLYAAHNPQLKAGVAWYGRLVGRANELQPKHPIDVAASLKAPVLGLYGGADSGIPLDTVEQMRNALKTQANPSEIIVYPNTPHGFHADYRPSYRKEQAEDGWKRLREWFKKHRAA